MDQSLGSKENIGQRDIFDLFPRVSTFRKDKLPTLKETIGVARGYKESNNCTFQDATVVVAHKLYDHWFSRNIYPITWQGIKKKLNKEFQEIRKLSRTSMNKKGKSWAQAYKNKLKKNPTNYLIYFVKVNCQGKALKSSMDFQCLMRITDFLSQWEQIGKRHVKENKHINITLQKLVKGNKEKSMKNYKRVIFYQFPVWAPNTCS